jgi:peptidoglycan/LPS O-acetylase OafA/YrhL
MSRDLLAESKRRYLPCLQGLRGYGFLLVFCGHYLLAGRLAHPGTVRLKLLTAVASLGLFAVPAFFVLSGYLIGGILYHTRNREGFFRVFYLRRVLRVFPVFYIALLGIAGFCAMRGIPTDTHFWSHFLYIQNLQLGQTNLGVGPVALSHFWSLAVEEQFYLVWPLIVWCFRDRKKLIVVSAALIVVCCGIRFAAPWLGIAVLDMSFFTLTRVDAVLMGVLLSLLGDSKLVQRAKPYAKWVALGGAVTFWVLAVVKGETWAMTTYAGKETWITLANFTGVAVLLAVLEEGSFLNRICSHQWICFVGALSYSLYVFHYLYRPYFLSDVTDYFARHMRLSFASLMAAGIALCITFALSLICMKFVELPLMKLKQFMPYGPPKDVHAEASRRAEPAFVERGA